MFSKYFSGVLLASLVILNARVVSACESCAIPRLGRDNGHAVESRDKKFFAEYLFEEQNWHEKEADEGHRLHHQGYHFHDKTREEFHHLTLGARPDERWTVLTQIPYVVRHSIEVDDHDILGSNQRSQGLGDLNLIGVYQFLKKENSNISVLGGVKFPTGSTGELNSVGTRFEPELQPGSGSYDYIVGGVYKLNAERQSLTANLTYIFKTEGDQDFEYGDVLTVSGLWDYQVNPQSQNWQTRVGLDASFQYEQKQKSNGERIADSGGVTIMLGPALTVAANKTVALTASFLLPMYQNLGGVHQTLDYVWTAGGKVSW